MKTKAAVLRQMELPRPYAESRPLSVEEVDLDGPGENEVLVQVAGAGLCHSDLSVINGSRPRPVPMVMGHEAAGVVRDVGPGVKGLSPDDHVVFSFVPCCGGCPMCAIGRAPLCEPAYEAAVTGQLLHGGRRFTVNGGGEVNHHQGVSGYSEFTVAAPESLVKIDKSLPIEMATLFGCAIMTGVGAVVNTARVQPGTTTAIFGLGGVGLSVVLGLRLAGAYPIIAVDRLENKLALAKEAGATHVINAAEVDPVMALRDLTDGGAADVFEAVGSEKVLAQAYAATRKGGRTITVGLPDPTRELKIPALSLVAEERQLMGSYMGSCVPKRDIPRFMRLYAEGRLPVDVLNSRFIDLEQVNESFDALDRGEVARQIIKFES
ncbi:MAG: alcohol dehydrogenase [Roseibacillus sp.]|nr:alcohol dehydrogenase [Roseibacillus sp.]HJN81809.1 zinc-dependent alcohol dehydrogenase family protein [Verrucomicrobiota bacterium]